MSRKMRSLAVLVVLALVATGSVGALPLEATRTAEGGTGFLFQIWEWLASWAEPEGAQTGHDLGQPQEKEGSQMDPNGGH